MHPMLYIYILLLWSTLKTVSLVFLIMAFLIMAFVIMAFLIMAAHTDAARKRRHRCKMMTPVVC